MGLFNLAYKYFRYEQAHTCNSLFEIIKTEIYWWVNYMISKHQNGFQKNTLNKTTMFFNLNLTLYVIHYT